MPRRCQLSKPKEKFRPLVNVKSSGTMIVSGKTKMGIWFPRQLGNFVSEYSTAHNALSITLQHVYATALACNPLGGYRVCAQDSEHRLIFLVVGIRSACLIDLFMCVIIHSVRTCSSLPQTYIKRCRIRHCGSSLLCAHVSVPEQQQLLSDMHLKIP